MSDLSLSSVLKGAALVGLGVFLGTKLFGKPVPVKPRKHSVSPGVYRVVLTGGPCGGKSSAQGAMAKALQEQGVQVFFMPEVPTILINGGCLPTLLSSMDQANNANNATELVKFEAALLKLQIETEDCFNCIASQSLNHGNKKVVVFYDRGALDPAAYLPGVREGSSWKSILESSGVTEQQLFGRYDLVLHLVSAADGAEAFYTTANNAARTETAEQARELDGNTFKSWQGHHQLHRIDNSTDFPKKMQKCVDLVARLVAK